MSHSYPRTSAGSNSSGFCPCWSRPAVGPSPAPWTCMTFSAGCCNPEKRVPVANAARGLPQLAYLLQVFPAMERAAWPGSGPILEQVLKKIGSRPDKVDGKSRPASIVIPGVKNTDTAGPRAMTQARRCPESRHIAVDTGLPHGILPPMRPGWSFGERKPGRPQPGPEGAGRTFAKLVGGLGGSGETQRTAHLRGASKAMGGGAVFRLAGREIRRRCQTAL